MWRWSIGRGGVEGTWGLVDSYDEARKAAEEAALAYAKDAQRTTFYLYDTDTQECVGIKEG